MQVMRVDVPGGWGQSLTLQCVWILRENRATVYKHDGGLLRSDFEKNVLMIVSGLKLEFQIRIYQEVLGLFLGGKTTCGTKHFFEVVVVRWS